MENEKHPSVEGYLSSEPIPEGYKLDRVFVTRGMEQFAIEFLIPIVAIETTGTEILTEEKAA